MQLIITVGAPSSCGKDLIVIVLSPLYLAVQQVLLSDWEVNKSDGQATYVRGTPVAGRKREQCIVLEVCFDPQVPEAEDDNRKHRRRLSLPSTLGGLPSWYMWFVIVPHQAELRGCWP